MIDVEALTIEEFMLESEHYCGKKDKSEGSEKKMDDSHTSPKAGRLRSWSSNNQLFQSSGKKSEDHRQEVEEAAGA